MFWNKYASMAVDQQSVVIIRLYICSYTFIKLGDNIRYTVIVD